MATKIRKFQQNDHQNPDLSQTKSINKVPQLEEGPLIHMTVQKIYSSRPNARERRYNPGVTRRDVNAAASQAKLEKMEF